MHTRHHNQGVTTPHAKPDLLALRADLEQAFVELMNDLSLSDAGRAIGRPASTISRRAEAAARDNASLMSQYEDAEWFALALVGAARGFPALVNVLQASIDNAMPKDADGGAVRALRELQTMECANGALLGEFLSDDQIDAREHPQVIASLDRITAAATKAKRRLLKQERKP